MLICILSLCPKSYFAICFDKEAENDKDSRKVASKGVSKKTNKFQYSQYKEVCYENKTYDATNFTMRVQDKQMRTLKCMKRGLGGVHVKNQVQDDRISTVPHKRQRMEI